jgi:hypothetical protein
MILCPRAVRRCHITGNKVPKGDGFVYAGKDYLAIEH